MEKLIEKIEISATAKILTGMHIGAGNAYSAIGAVDSFVVKDSLTMQPIIPGSSLKGKMRYLLETSKKYEEADIKKLFGHTDDGFRNSRLQYYDSFLTKQSAQMLKKASTDLLYTEIKFENTIDRTSLVANPRQQERVVAGSEFVFKLVYNYYENADINKDFELLRDAIELLHMDYLGGSGTRGYGRVQLINITVQSTGFSQENIDINALERCLKNAKNNPLYSEV